MTNLAFPLPPLPPLSDLFVYLLSFTTADKQAERFWSFLFAPPLLSPLFVFTESCLFISASRIAAVEWKSCVLTVLYPLDAVHFLHFWKLLPFLLLFNSFYFSLFFLFLFTRCIFSPAAPLILHCFCKYHVRLIVSVSLSMCDRIYFKLQEIRIPLLLLLLWKFVVLSSTKILFSHCDGFALAIHLHSSSPSPFIRFHLKHAISFLFFVDCIFSDTTWKVCSVFIHSFLLFKK